MKALATFAILGLLAGCAAPTPHAYQIQCEKQYTSFPRMVACMQSRVEENGEPLTPRRKLYMLGAGQLSQRVRNGEITDSQAKTELQALYVKLKTEKNAEN